MTVTHHPQEDEQRKKLDSLEFPRVLHKADGTQQRVENLTEAKKALDEGLTLMPTAPAPHDGGTPNLDPTQTLAPGIAAVINRAVADAVSTTAPGVTPTPHPVPPPPQPGHPLPPTHPVPPLPKPPVPDEDDEDAPKRRR